MVQDIRLTCKKKSIKFLNSNNKHVETKIQNKISFTLTKIIKYVGIKKANKNINGKFILKFVKS